MFLRPRLQMPWHPRRMQGKLVLMLSRNVKYGEPIEEGDAVQDGDWPKGAARSRDYFAEKFNLADEPLNEHRFVLQYAFDDGRPLTAARESVAN